MEALGAFDHGGEREGIFAGDIEDALFLDVCSEKQSASKIREGEQIEHRVEAKGLKADTRRKVIIKLAACVGSNALSTPQDDDLKAAHAHAHTDHHIGLDAIANPLRRVG